MAIFRSKRKGMKLLGNMVGTTILDEQTQKDITDRMNNIESLSDINNVSRDIALFLCDSLKSIRGGIVKYNIENKKMKFISQNARWDECDKYDDVGYAVESVKDTAGTKKFFELIQLLGEAVGDIENKGFDKNKLEQINGIFEEIFSKKFGGCWRESVLDNRDVKNKFKEWHKELENVIDLLKKLSEKANQLIKSPPKQPLKTTLLWNCNRNISNRRVMQSWCRDRNINTSLYGGNYTQGISYGSKQKDVSENCQLNWSFRNFDKS